MENADRYRFPRLPNTEEMETATDRAAKETMEMIMKRRWTSRAAWRYLLLQLPGLALVVMVLILIGRWIDLPAWLFWGMIVSWVVKDLVVFPFVWRAYDPQDGGNPMLGARGVAQERLAPSGYIRIRGELWKAQAAGDRAIDRGETVRVRAARGLILIVEPEADGPKDAQR
jgi:membrane protein implicated in regulation of membrane protease activity